MGRQTPYPVAGQLQPVYGALTTRDTATGFGSHLGGGIGPGGTVTPGLVGPATEPSASGTKYYVSKNGNDGNSGTSKSDAYKTFAPLSDSSTGAVSGDVIVILETGDEYDVILNDEGDRFQPEDSNITVCGEQGTFPTVKADYGGLPPIRIFYDNIVLRGFHIEGPNTDIGGPNDGQGDYGIRFDNRNNSASLPLTKDERKAAGWVYNVKTTHHGNSGILFGGNTVGGVAEHVHAAYNYGPEGNGENSDGIQFTGAPNEKVTGGWVEGCLMHHNSDDGYDGYRSYGCVVKDCMAFANGYREDGSTTGVDPPGKGIKLGGGDDIDIGGSIAQRCVSFGNGASGFGANGANLPVDFVNCTAFNNARKNERDYEKDYELYEGQAGPSGQKLQNSRIVNCIGEQGVYTSLEAGSIDSSNIIKCNFDAGNNFAPSFDAIPFATLATTAADYPRLENHIARIDTREDGESLPRIINNGSTGYQPTPASDIHGQTDVVDYAEDAPDLGGFETRAGGTGTVGGGPSPTPDSLVILEDWEDGTQSNWANTGETSITTNAIQGTYSIAHSSSNFKKVTSGPGVTAPLDRYPSKGDTMTWLVDTDALTSPIWLTAFGSGDGTVTSMYNVHVQIQSDGDVRLREEINGSEFTIASDTTGTLQADSIYEVTLRYYYDSDVGEDRAEATVYEWDLANQTRGSEVVALSGPVDSSHDANNNGVIELWFSDDSAQIERVDRIGILTVTYGSTVYGDATYGT